MRREKSEDVIVKAAVEQVELAIEAANAIILVVNVQEGITPLDEEVARRLRRADRPVLVAVNKVDTEKVAAEAEIFRRLGFDKMFPVTAIHGTGIEDLMTEAAKFLPPEDVAEADSFSAGERGEPVEGEEAPRQRSSNEPLKLAIVGRPNVGKSSIINALTNSERVIVTPIAGTTRDAIDVPFEVETDGVRQKYILIDTAGMRKRNRVDDSIEFFSVKRSEDSIMRADICVLVLDAESGILEQDKKIAAQITEARKACIFVINKWDLLEEAVRMAGEEEIARRNRKDRDSEKRMTTLAEFGAWVQELLFFLDYAPVIFTSAKSGFHLDRLLEAVRYVAAELKKQIPTSLLNRTLRDSVDRRQPISATGHRLKFYYATQVRRAPPTFLMFVNRDELFSDQYKKHLANDLRKAFGYEGCPIVLVAKPRPKTIAPVRKFKERSRETKERKHRGPRGRVARRHA
jgi:GTP-binding protein